MSIATLQYQLPEQQAELEAALMGADAVRVLRALEAHLIRELRTHEASTPESKVLRRVYRTLRELERGTDLAPKGAVPLEDDGTPHEEDDED